MKTCMNTIWINLKSTTTMKTIDFTKIQAAQLEDFANASDELF